jgi:hypothetical protein
MFSGFKYRSAVIRALMKLAQHGWISDSDLKLMVDVSSNRINHEYGKSLIKSGAAVNKHAAAAAVFARLSVAAQSGSTTGITADDWERATRFAMMNAGATEAMSYLAAKELIQFQREQAEIPLSELLA